jgi:hypothetical protein
VTTATPLDTPAAPRGADNPAAHAAPPPILNGEPLIGLVAAGRLLPGHRANRHVDGATIWRWIVKGAKSTSGGVVRLEAVRVGGRWVTSAGAVRRFVAALTEASLVGTETTATPVASPASRKHRAATASAELDALMG